MDRRKNDRPELDPKLLPRTDPILVENYANVLAAFPDAQFVMDDDVVRFRRNCLFQWLGAKWKGPCYNDLAKAYFDGEFPLEEQMDFYQGIGYSVSGFLDIFWDEVEAMVETGRVARTGGRAERAQTLLPKED